MNKDETREFEYLKEEVHYLNLILRKTLNYLGVEVWHIDAKPATVEIKPIKKESKNDRN